MGRTCGSCVCLMECSYIHNMLLLCLSPCRKNHPAIYIILCDGKEVLSGLNVHVELPCRHNKHGSRLHDDAPGYINGHCCTGIISIVCTVYSFYYSAQIEYKLSIRKLYWVNFRGANFIGDRNEISWMVLNSVTATGAVLRERCNWYTLALSMFSLLQSRKIRIMKTSTPWMHLGEEWKPVSQETFEGENFRRSIGRENFRREDFRGMLNWSHNGFIVLKRLWPWENFCW